MMQLSTSVNPLEESNNPVCKSSRSKSSESGIYQDSDEDMYDESSDEDDDSEEDDEDDDETTSRHRLEWDNDL